MLKPICTVMVGLPGLGKSTHVEHELKIYDVTDTDVTVYSTDDYIESVAAKKGKTYDEVFSETIGEATGRMDEYLRYAIKDGRDVIWDQTNIGIGKRKKIINRMKQAGYQVRCICIAPPEASHIDDQKEWKYRLVNRKGKTIPEHIMANMIKSYVTPSTKEGFDMVVHYNMHGALIGTDYGEDV